MTRAWTRSCAACSVRKGLIFLMLCSANLQDRAVFAMCSLKVSWSSKITPRFLTEADGVIVDEPNWIFKSCCRVGVAGKTRSSVFARLSCRWCSFIHTEMSARQPEIRQLHCQLHWHESANQGLQNYYKLSSLLEMVGVQICRMLAIQKQDWTPLIKNIYYLLKRSA